MVNRTNPVRIPLPRGWPHSVKSAMLHVISLAQFGMAYTPGWAVSTPIARMRLKAENEQLRQLDDDRDFLNRSRVVIRQVQDIPSHARRTGQHPHLLDLLKDRLAMGAV